VPNAPCANSRFDLVTFDWEQLESRHAGEPHGAVTGSRPLLDKHKQQPWRRRLAQWKTAAPSKIPGENVREAKRIS